MCYLPDYEKIYFLKLLSYEYVMYLGFLTAERQES